MNNISFKSFQDFISEIHRVNAYYFFDIANTIVSNQINRIIVISKSNLEPEKRTAIIKSLREVTKKFNVDYPICILTKYQDHEI